MSRTLRNCAIACVVATLAACATSAPQPPPAPPVNVEAMVAQVRFAAGAPEPREELAIQPLRDPVVEDLRARAKQAETEHRYADAVVALDRALVEVDDDPSLLQDRAEAALLVRDFDGAEKFAERGYAVGAQVGPLCRRHWATILAVRKLHDDTAGAAAAEQSLAACKVTAPPRY
jgi:hypothetical protein